MTGRVQQVIAAWGGDREAAFEEILTAAEHDHRMRYAGITLPCTHSALSPSERETMAWVTAVGNADAMLPVVVLSFSLETYSCVRNKVVFVNSNLERVHKDALVTMGFRVIDVGGEELPDISCISLGLASSHPRQNAGTYYRFYAWLLLDYARVIYADADYMLLSNVDELFLANPDCGIAGTRFDEPGIAAHGFFAGLLVICPNVAVSRDLIAEWKRVAPRTDCVNDQAFLYHYYSQAGRRIHFLPYSYQVVMRAYYPMRAFHFAGEDVKVWRTPVTRANAQDIPIVNVPGDVMIVFWHTFYSAIIYYSLGAWAEESVGISNE